MTRPGGMPPSKARSEMMLWKAGKDIVRAGSDLACVVLGPDPCAPRVKQSHRARPLPRPVS